MKINGVLLKISEKMSTYLSSGGCGDGGDGDDGWRQGCDGGHSGGGGGGGQGSNNKFTSTKKAIPKKVKRRGLGIAELEKMMREERRREDNGNADSEVDSSSLDSSNDTEPVSHPLSLVTRQNLEQYKASRQQFQGLSYSGGNGAFNFTGLPSFQSPPSLGFPQMQPPSFQGSYGNCTSFGPTQQQVMN